MEIQNMTFFGIEPFDVKKINKVRENVSLTVSAGQVTITKYTFEKFGSPKFVEVGFNQQKNIFAVKPVSKETKYSIAVNNSGSHQIIGKIITNKIRELRGWDSANNNLILKDGNFDSESGYWLFDLDGAEEVAKRRYVGRPNRRK